MDKVKEAQSEGGDPSDEEKKKRKSTTIIDGSVDKKQLAEADANVRAYQELYELTQRKFLKKLREFGADRMSAATHFANLICLDMQEKNDSSNGSESNKDPLTTTRNYTPCLRVMCEHDEGWHLSESSVSLDGQVPASFCSYLCRLMNILRHGEVASQMIIFALPDGQRVLDQVEERASLDESDIADSYVALRQHFINEWSKKALAANASTSDADAAASASSGEQRVDLKRCELKNGKVLFLCDKHAKATKARVITNAKIVNVSVASEQAAGASGSLLVKMLDDIAKPKRFEIVNGKLLLL